MKAYVSYLKSEIMAGIQYKAAALAGISTQFFWGVVLIMVYKAFYSYSSISSINFRELICYVWLGQAFFSVIYININDSEITSKILNGTVAYELCRPYNLFCWWFMKLLAKRYSAVILRFLPIIIVSLILPKPYNLTLPITLLAFILFIISMFLGSIIVSMLNVLIRLITFFTMQEKGLTSIVCRIGDLLAGMILPLPLLPAIFSTIGEYLPFRLVGDLPFRIYSGNIMTGYALKSIVLQIIWIILLTIIGNMLMKISLKKVCIQGG